MGRREEEFGVGDVGDVGVREPEPEPEIELGAEAEAEKEEDVDVLGERRFSEIPFGWLMVFTGLGRNRGGEGGESSMGGRSLCKFPFPFAAP